MDGRPGIGVGAGAWVGDAGARRLLACVRAACDGEEGLPARLEAALRAALGLLAADPDLARLLTVDPYLAGDEELFDAQQAWIGRFAALLEDAAAADPDASPGPSFVARFLVGGVRMAIARLVLQGEATELMRLLPGTLETMLAYYFEPGDPRRRAAHADGAGAAWSPHPPRP